MCAIEKLEGDLELIRADLKDIKEIDMKQDDRDKHHAADKCWIFGDEFKQYSQGDTRVASGKCVTMII